MIDDTLLEAEEKMDKAIEFAKEEFAAIRTGRANAAMFSKLHVDYYGSPTPLQQLASFNIPEARTVLISPYDKSSLHAIEKAIRDSDLGVNPTDDGGVIRIVLPLSAPGLAAVAIFTFTGAWNELLLALVLITSESQRTAPLALNYLITSDVLPWGPLMAGAVLSSVPLMILYFLAQRFMVQGLTSGSVKG